MTDDEFNELIDKLKIDLRMYEEMLSEVSRDMIGEGYSAYPVFMASEHSVKIGERILDKQESLATYNIYATTLEELIERKLVLPERKNEFIKAYKNPVQYMCIMLVTRDIASFVFVPYLKGGTD